MLRRDTEATMVRLGTYATEYIQSSIRHIMGNIHDLSKIAELEDLINRSLHATFKWEQAGEKSYGNEMLEAATVIKNHTPKIVKLYTELIKLRGSSNLYVKNKVLPAPMPSEIHVQMAIMGIFQFASALESKKSSFRGQLIERGTKDELTRIIAGCNPMPNNVREPVELLESASEVTNISHIDTTYYRSIDGYFWRTVLIGTSIIIGFMFAVLYGFFALDDRGLIDRYALIVVLLMPIPWSMFSVRLINRHLKKKGYYI